MMSTKRLEPRILRAFTKASAALITGLLDSLDEAPRAAAVADVERGANLRLVLNVAPEFAMFLYVSAGDPPQFRILASYPAGNEPPESPALGPVH